MAQKIDADVDIRRFGFASDEGSKRLLFPHATAHNLDGKSGAIAYGAKELVFDELEGRLNGVRWQADTASLGEAWLRDDTGSIEMTIQRAELPRGIMLVGAEKGVEIVAPHASLSEMQLTMKIPPPAPPPPPGTALTPRRPSASSTIPPNLRQEAWRLLDGVAGKINLTIKVKLDLPVVGMRSLDQVLKIPIVDGRLDYRALNESLDWLEGTFLDLDVDEDRLAVSFKVPIFGASRDLISWQLDDEAEKMARFGRVPLRSLVDFHIGSGSPGAPRSDDKKRSSILRSLTLANIDVALSMLAPRSLDVGGGTIMFGGDDAPGIVNFQIAGSISDTAAGFLRGTAGSVDTTVKDLHMGGMTLTADRLSFDRIEDLQVAFEGFRPTAVSVTIHRVTASNLRLAIG